MPQYGYVACAWATLACYVLMTILSYRLCQKHYVIPYRIKDITLYFVAAGILYAMNSSLSISNALVLYGIKTLSIFTFIAVVIMRERIQIVRNNS